jgi:hypothetical protein
MEFRQALFWDTDPEKIDPEKHAQYIIERVLDFGHDDEVRWVWNTYSKTLLRKVVTRSRSLQPKTKALWELLLQN